MDSDKESVTKGYMKAIADKREKLLAQERYELVKLYTGQMAAVKPGFFGVNSLSDIMRRTMLLVNEVIKHHPLYPTKEKGEG